MIHFPEKNKEPQIINDLDKNPQINYPCLWEFKLIGREDEELKTAVTGLIQHRDFTFRSSNISKNKKFVSYSLLLTVENQKDRDHIFQQLSAHKHVVMVL